MLLCTTLTHAEERPARADASQGRPDIVLITLDTTRADHTSAYGYRRPTTPRLDRLAREGVRFAAAYAPMATTLPSHATMFTGRLPRTLGVLKNGQVVPESTTTLAELLAEKGYRTAAFVSSFPVHRQFGLAQGFSAFDDDFAGGDCPMALEEWEGFDVKQGFCRRGDRTVERAAAWLEANGYLGPRRKDQPPLFLWVHLFDPHAPYAPPEADAALFPARRKPKASAKAAWLAEKIAAYDGEIHFMDRVVGDLLDRLERAGRSDDTLLVIAGDHGEGLMQHGWMHHSLLLYEEDVRVPLLVRWPRRVHASRLIEESVQLADLTPTLVELAGAAPSAVSGSDGTSLARVLTEGARPDPERPAFLQRRQYDEPIVEGVRVRGEKLALRRGRWKYIEARDEGTAELYDLEKDPGETRNLATAHPGETARLSAELRRWQASTKAPTLPPVSDEASKRLRALGYVP
jgi:arylsulfatase A-like enzyme